MTHRTEFIEVRDLPEMAFILAVTAQKYGMIPTAGNEERMKFIVLNTEQARAAVVAFGANGKIGVQDYLRAMEKVKDRVMNAKRALRHGRVVYGAVE